MKHFISTLSMIVLIIAIGLAVLLAYWFIYPYDVLEIKNEPTPVTEPENIKSGRLIFITIDYCKYINVSGVVERQLVSDREVIDLPVYDDTTPVGCNKIDVPLLLPYTILDQTFYIHYKVTYQVNPVRTLVEEFKTSTFVIKPVVELPIEE